jgi:hypothetical protein
MELAQGEVAEEAGLAQRLCEVLATQLRQAVRRFAAAT